MEVQLEKPSGRQSAEQSLLFGRYRITDLIAVGATGLIFAAVDVKHVEAIADADGEPARARHDCGGAGWLAGWLSLVRSGTQSRHHGNTQTACLKVHACVCACARGLCVRLSTVSVRCFRKFTSSLLPFAPSHARIKWSHSVAARVDHASS